MVRRLIGWAALATAAGGCGPGWTAEAGGKGTGYDVYRPEPYLLVVQGGASTQPAAGPRYSAQIVYLPDYSQRYRVRSNAGGTTIVIRDGWMLSELADTNALASLVSSALSSAGPGGPGGGVAGLATLAAVTQGEASSSSAQLPTAGALAGGRPGVSLFKIVYGPSGRVTGLDRVQPVEGEMPRSGSLADHAPPPVPVYAPD